MRRYRTVEAAAAAKDWSAVRRMINAPRSSSPRLPAGAGAVITAMASGDGGAVPANLYPDGWLERCAAREAGAERPRYGALEAPYREPHPLERQHAALDAYAELAERTFADEILEACAADDCRGFCLACGTEAYGVEPDARRYRCESCGERRVYGAQELVIMGAAS